MRKKSEELDRLATDLTASNHNRPLCGVSEAARLARYCEDSIYDAIASGALAAIKRRPRGTLTIRVRELARWLLALEQAASK